MTNLDQDSQKGGDSGDSVVEVMPRKLTRSLAARVSRMAACKPNNTDTDSEADDKANEKMSKEDKRLAKARAALTKSPAVLNHSQQPSERQCPAMTNNEDLNEDKEPVLDGFVPDYDLRLFRDAQALAAVKSPYPGEAARVPRLFVCEFCLKHHKCAAGADRHRSKCGRPETQVVLPAAVPPRQVLPRPQNSLLRRGAFPLLRYLLTKEEGKVGSPETPLSDLGLISYRSYWKEAILKRLCSAPGPTLCIRDLSKDLAIASSDIVSTLQERGLMKYWKGKHIVLKKQCMNFSKQWQEMCRLIDQWTVLI
ncbi:unnamed protein product, partial [Leptidea sinapis]